MRVGIQSGATFLATNLLNTLSMTVADDVIEAKRREMEENVSVIAEYWFETQNSDAGSAEPDGFVSWRQ